LTVGQLTGAVNGQGEIRKWIRILNTSPLRISFVFSTFRRTRPLKKFCFGGHWVIGVFKIESYYQKSEGLNWGGGGGGVFVETVSLWWSHYACRLSVRVLIVTIWAFLTIRNDTKPPLRGGEGAKIKFQVSPSWVGAVMYSGCLNDVPKT
jgi:hypothetical protein